MPPRLIVPGLALLIAFAGGCEPAPVHRSPTSDEASERFARALQEAEAVRRANREAEAAFYRKARLDPPPNPLKPDLSTAHTQIEKGQL